MVNCVRKQRSAREGSAALIVYATRTLNRRLRRHLTVNRRAVTAVLMRAKSVTVEPLAPIVFAMLDLNLQVHYRSTASSSVETAPLIQGKSVIAQTISPAPGHARTTAPAIRSVVTIHAIPARTRAPALPIAVRPLQESCLNQLVPTAWTMTATGSPIPMTRIAQSHRFRRSRGGV